MQWTTAELIELPKLIAKFKEFIPLRNPASPVVKMKNVIIGRYCILTTGDAGLRKGMNSFNFAISF